MGAAYLVQGLRSKTLVAGKTTALRLVTAPWSPANAAATQATVLRPDGSVENLSWILSQLVCWRRRFSRIASRQFPSEALIGGAVCLDMCLG